jgi:DNA-binding transcriptional ArsR family regulator
MVSSPQRQESAAARTEPLPEKTVEMVAAVLKVLSDPTRIRLVEILNDRGSATVGALTPCFSVSQQRVSQQLAVLHQAGVVRRRRQGIHVRYELADFTCWWVVQQLASGLVESPDGSLS